MPNFFTRFLIIALLWLGGSLFSWADNTYYLLPDAGNQPLSVISLDAQNKLQVGNQLMGLNALQAQQFAPGSLTNIRALMGTGDFALGSTAPATDLPVPKAFLSNEFVLPQLRYAHQLIILSPQATANVTIDRGGVLDQFTIPAGGSKTFLAGNNNAQATLIYADQPIGIYHRGYQFLNNWVDVYALPPASSQLIGVRSGSVRVAALRDNTQITVYASDATQVQYVLNKAEQQTVNLGANTSAGRGSSLRITATQPIAAIQVNDGSGNEASAFWPLTALASYFALPVDAQYWALACPFANTSVTLTPPNAAKQTVNCGGSAIAPGKAYFGSATSGAFLLAGTTLKSTAPVYGIYQDDTYAAERNLAGKAYSYWLIDPQTQTTPLDVVSLVNQNTIASESKFAAAAAPLVLNQGGLGQLAAGVQLAAGQRIWGSEFFSVGNTSNGHDVLIVPELLGTQFVVPQVRDQHRYYLLSPLADAKVTVTIGTSQTVVNLIAGKLSTFEASSLVGGNSNTVAARFNASTAIAVYHLSHTGGAQRNYVFAVPPATTQVFGVHSNTRVAALNDDTQITITSSEGAVESTVLAAGEQWQPNLGVTLPQSQGAAVSVQANKPLAAIQLDDGDGNEAAAFWPASYFKTDYRLPADAQYAVVVCNQANTQVTLTQGTDTTTQVCAGSATQPGNLYWGVATNGVSITKGSLFHANKPIYLMYEAAASNDERNLWGANLPITTTPPAPATAAVSFGGTLTKNTQWIAGKNYQANASVIIPAGITATIRAGAIIDMTNFDWTVQGKVIIEAGAKLKFSKDHYLAVQATGQLIATGSSTQPVVFTSNSATPAPQDWIGIRLTDESRIQMQYATIEYASTGIYYSTGKPSGYIKHSTLQNNWYAVSGRYTPQVNDLSFTHNLIANNQISAVVWDDGGQPVFNFNQFINNGPGKGTAYGDNIQVFSGQQINNQDLLLNFRYNWWGSDDPVKIKQSLQDGAFAVGASTLVDYRGYRLLATGQETNPSLQLLGYVDKDLVLSSANQYSVLNRLTIVPSATLTVASNVQSYSSWQVQGNLIVQGSGKIIQKNTSSVVVSGTARFEAGSQYYGCGTNPFATQSLLQIIDNGLLIVTGTKAAPVLFSVTKPLAQSNDIWGGIALSGNAAVQINNAVIEQAYIGMNYTGAIRGFIKNSIFNSSFYNIYGHEAMAVTDFKLTSNQFLQAQNYNVLLYSAGYPVFNFNQFETANVSRVYVDYENNAPPFTKLDFRYNWWGTDDIEKIEAYIQDVGDGTSYEGVFVDHSGYRRSPDGNETDPNTQLLGEITTNRVLPADQSFEVLNRLIIKQGVTLTLQGPISSVQGWDIQGTVLAKGTARIHQRVHRNINIFGSMVFSSGAEYSAVKNQGDAYTVLAVKDAGKLTVNGGQTLPVLFHTPDPLYASDLWGGISLEGNAEVKLNYALIQNASYGIRYTGKPHGTIQNSIFENMYYGVLGNDAQQVNDLVFTGNNFRNIYYNTFNLNSGGYPLLRLNQFESPRIPGIRYAIALDPTNYPPSAPKLDARNNCWISVEQEKEIISSHVTNGLFFFLEIYSFLLEKFFGLSLIEQQDVKQDILTFAEFMVTSNVDVSDPELHSEDGKRCGAGGENSQYSDGQFNTNTTIPADQELVLGADGEVAAGVTLTVNGKFNSNGYDLTVDGHLILTANALANWPASSTLNITDTGSLTLAEGSKMKFQEGGITLAPAAIFTAQGSAASPIILSGFSSSSTSRWLGISTQGQLNLNYLAILGAERALVLGNGARGSVKNSQLIFNDMGLVLSGNTSAATVQSTVLAGNRIGIVCDACTGNSAIISASSIYANTEKNIRVLGTAPTGTLRVTNNWWDKTTLAAVNTTFQNTSALVINANPFLTTAPVLMDPRFGNDPRLLQALQIEYLHYDAFNSPVAATNQAGTVLWQEHYQPYGESRVNTDPNPTVNYTGHALDRDSGLIYAGARYMDPVVGRFMSIDPVEFVESNPLSFNRYAYANNSPYAFYDPDGQVPVDYLVDGVSIAISAGMYANDPSVANAAGLAGDVILGALPYIPAGIGILRSADKAVDAAKVAEKTSQADFIVSPNGTALPTNKDFNLVDSAKEGGDWLQIHNKHTDAKVNGSPHTHYPKQHNGSRTREINRTNGADLDRADAALKNGSMRERQNREDRGGSL